jgi:hypothetical protein
MDFRLSLSMLRGLQVRGHRGRLAAVAEVIPLFPRIHPKPFDHIQEIRLRGFIARDSGLLACDLIASAVGRFSCCQKTL